MANPVDLKTARDHAIAVLSDAFAHDLIEVEDFERRLTLAHQATTLPEVAETVSDLTASTSGTALVPAATAVPIVLAGGSESDRVMAIFGGVERHGAWRVPSHLQASAVFGGMILDFREAVFAPGVTEINVAALMGGIQLIVPPGLSVEVSGTAIMGGFGHVERAPVQADPDRPVLRVHGLAIMGGVAVETRLPGESETDAHRRRRSDRRTFASPGAPKRLAREDAPVRSIDAPMSLKMDHV